MADKIAKLLAKLPKKDLQLLLPVIKQLVENTDYSGLDIKALKGSQGLLRVRAGNYRVIFKVVHGQMKIVAISRRNERTYRDY
jgi:mRNA-degrading endonuclease RelE of RelBE toxin-antitoxin system